MKARLKAIAALSCILFAACYSGSHASNEIGNSSQQSSSPAAILMPSSTPSTGNQEMRLKEKQQSNADEKEAKRILEMKESCNGELEEIKSKYNRILTPDSIEREINEYKRVISEGCDTKYSRLYLGNRLQDAGHLEESAEQYRLILKRYPQDWATHWLLAQILIIKLGQYEEGLKEAQISRQLDDGGDIGYVYDYYIGKAYDGLGNYDEAIKHYEIFIKAQSKVRDNDPRLLEAKERLKVIMGK